MRRGNSSGSIFDAIYSREEGTFFEVFASNDGTLGDFYMIFHRARMMLEVEDS